MAAPNRKVVHRSFAAVQIPIFMYNKTVIKKVISNCCNAWKLARCMMAGSQSPQINGENKV